MTDFATYRERTRDIQDYNERGLWGGIEYVDGAGAVMSIRGTDTLDQEAPLMNTGYGFNVPKDFNTEVMMVSLGSDTNAKYAMATIPRDKQRKWAENTGGVQHPTNPDKAIEFSDGGIWLKDGTFFLGDDKDVKITVSGGAVTFECASLDFKTGTLTHNGTNIGDDHVHGGVEPGGSNTDGPQ